MTPLSNEILISLLTDKDLIKTETINQLQALHICKPPTEKKNVYRFPLYENYGLFYSSIRELRTFLYKYAIKKIDIYDIVTETHKDFFVFNLPTGIEERNHFILLLDSIGIKYQNQINLHFSEKSFSKIETSFLSSNFKNLPKFWAERLPILEQELSNASTIVYKPTKNPKFPLFFAENINTAPDFVNFYNKTLYDFFYLTVILHLPLFTGLYKQNEIQTIYAKTTDILNLLPANCTLSGLLKQSSPSREINQTKNYLSFTYREKFLSNFRFQRVNVPFSLLRKAFHPTHLGRNGLPFLLLFIFAYHGKNHRIRYKPSTLINVGKISTQRGQAYTLKVLNRNLSYLQKIGFIENYIPSLTKQDLKEDKGILFYMCDLADWQPPAQIKD